MSIEESEQPGHGEPPATTTGIKVGALVLTLGGLAWWIAGATQPATFLPIVLLGVIAAAPLLWYGRRLPDDGERERFHRHRRSYTLLNLGQLVAIVAVAVLAGPIGGAAWLIPGLIAIVNGLHFLPLSSMAAQPRYARLGIAVTLIGIAGVVLGATSGSVPRTLLVVGMCVAVALWTVPTLELLRIARRNRPPAETVHLSELGDGLGRDESDESLPH